MSIQETFAHNIRTYRKQAKLTQEELAERSGLHRTYIGSIEQLNKNVSLKIVARIADALGVEPTRLLEENPDASSTRIAPDIEIENEVEKAGAAFKSGDYALCSWTDDGLKLEPIDVNDEDITMRVLCTLAAQGHDDIIKEYDEIIAQIDLFLNERNRSDLNM